MPKTQAVLLGHTARAAQTALEPVLVFQLVLTLSGLLELRRVVGYAGSQRTGAAGSGRPDAAGQGPELELVHPQPAADWRAPAPAPHSSPASAPGMLPPAVLQLPHGSSQHFKCHISLCTPS